MEGKINFKKMNKKMEARMTSGYKVVFEEGLER